jgi:UDP-N-acetylmuramate--alanine ligase
MSALARYFKYKGLEVYGYDRTQTDLTKQLSSEGIDIHFEDSIDLIEEQIIKSSTSSLIVYTPAIPSTHTQLNYFIDNGFTIYKRSQVLGMLTEAYQGIAVAGTHGKTSITTLTTHLLYSSKVGCSAFLGGISKNYNTNFLFSEHSPTIVIEADEYDRSFHYLKPEMAVITSMDADHLDIYGSHDDVKQSFHEFAEQIQHNGYFLHHIDLDLSSTSKVLHNKDITIHTYSLDNTDADFYTINRVADRGFFSYDVVTPQGVIEDITLGISGRINVENSVASIALSLRAGVSFSELRESLANFEGVKRRFEYHVNNDNYVYIDDYAHHPAELEAFIGSIKELYSDKKITGIFQPHLFSRTQDFAKEFGTALSALDELVLLDIYPARERPIEGVSSTIILDKVKHDNKILCEKQEVLEIVRNKEIEVLLTMGAGDIDRLVEPIKNYLLKDKSDC